MYNSCFLQVFCAADRQKLMCEFYNDQHEMLECLLYVYITKRGVVNHSCAYLYNLETGKAFIYIIRSLIFIRRTSICFCLSAPFKRISPRMFSFYRLYIHKL